MSSTIRATGWCCRPRWGRLDDALPPETIPPDQCWALKRGKPHLNRARRQQALLRAPSRRRHRARNPDDRARRDHGAVPAVRHRRAMPRRGSRRSPASRSALADGMSLALANMGLREKLRNQALRDPLTGLYNRRYMEDCLQRFVRLADRENREVSVVMVDLDHFKRLNDTHGHAFGDSVLRDAAMTHRRRAARDRHRLPLWRRGAGGDPARLQPRARRRQGRGAARPRRGAEPRRTAREISASFGVASVPYTSTGVTDLLAAADARALQGQAGRPQPGGDARRPGRSSSTG